MKKYILMFAVALAVTNTLSASAFARGSNSSDPQASALDPNNMTTNKKIELVGEPPCPYANVNGKEKAPKIETAELEHGKANTAK